MDTPVGDPQCNKIIQKVPLITEGQSLCTYTVHFTQDIGFAGLMCGTGTLQRRQDRITLINAPGQCMGPPGVRSKKINAGNIHVFI